MMKFESTLENISKVEEYTLALRQTLHLPEDLYADILISLTEAVNNAIIHGNTCNQTKYVVINHIITNDCIKFIVQDEGCGFAPEKIPDPTCNENIDKLGGRGVMIMRHLAQRVVFSKKGTCVEMQFNRKGMWQH
jgi:serine/threonine-protein kinase RsbW